MSELSRAIVLRQMDVMMGLAHETLTDLTSDELLWTPDERCWTVHETAQGWAVDWEEPEPDDLGPPSLGWQLWHASWWLSMLLDHSFGAGTLTRERFRWEGPGRGFQVVEELQALLKERLTELDDQEWSRSSRTRWPYQDGRAFGLVAGWASMELTKNIAEMVRTRAYFRAR